MHILSDAQAASLREAIAQATSILDAASFVSLDGAPVQRKTAQTVQVSDTPKSQPKTRVSRSKRGGGAVLTAAKVAKIKGQLAGGQSANSIAREYGVHVTTINCIKYGKTWKHVAAPAATPTEVVLTA